MIEGGDWSRFRPRVVVIEASPPDDCGPLLTASGYEQAAFDGINRYFVRDEDRALIPALAAPVSALDDVIPYTYLRLIEAQSDLSPAVLTLARRVRRLAVRFPRLASVARRLLRPAL